MGGQSKSESRSDGVLHPGSFALEKQDQQRRGGTRVLGERLAAQCSTRQTGHRGVTLLPGGRGVSDV